MVYRRTCSQNNYTDKNFKTSKSQNDPGYTFQQESAQPSGVMYLKEYSVMSVEYLPQH